MWHHRPWTRHHADLSSSILRLQGSTRPKTRSSKLRPLLSTRSCHLLKPSKQRFSSTPETQTELHFAKITTTLAAGRPRRFHPRMPPRALRAFLGVTPPSQRFQLMAPFTTW